MRQFVYEVEDDENDGPSGKKCIGGPPWESSKIVYRKQRAVKTLAAAPKLRQTTTDLRKAAVSIIIKYEFNNIF